jgi:hypothetical protein
VATRPHARSVARATLACGVAAALLAAAPARAWNGRGHRLVARIAEARLSPRSRAAARALLAGAHLSEVAMWADDEAQRRPETAPWHYVNIGADDGGYDPARHCTGGNCVVARIEHFRRVLGDVRAGPAARSEALLFLVHLVGDVHQPLHAGRPEDRGGTRIVVASAGDLSLHRVYDALPDRCTSPPRERGAARALSAAIPRRTARLWAEATPADWATESHLLATHVYEDLRQAGTDGRVVLAPEGAERRCAMTCGQLAKAGVRLAAVIEEALGGGR